MSHPTPSHDQVEEQLRRAALLYIRTGDMLKYCSIMVDLNEWTEALAGDSLNDSLTD